MLTQALELPSGKITGDRERFEDADGVLRLPMKKPGERAALDVRPTLSDVGGGSRRGRLHGPEGGERDWDMTVGECRPLRDKPQPGHGGKVISSKP